MSEFEIRATVGNTYTLDLRGLFAHASDTIRVRVRRRPIVREEPRPGRAGPSIRSAAHLDVTETWRIR